MGGGVRIIALTNRTLEWCAPMKRKVTFNEIFSNDIRFSERMQWTGRAKAVSLLFFQKAKIIKKILKIDGE